MGVGALFHYVARVHRARVGDTLTLFDPERRVEAKASVVALGRDRIELAVAALEPGRGRGERAVRLVQGWPKGDKLDAIVRDATELGAAEIWLCASERAVPTDTGRMQKKMERLARVAEEAARQSGRSDAPDLAGPYSLADCLGADTADCRLWLIPSAVEPVGPRLHALSPHTSVSFYVGPEGGFSEAERALAEQHGVSVVHCGPFVLRTETVACALLGGLRLLDLPGPA